MKLIRETNVVTWLEFSPVIRWMHLVFGSVTFRTTLIMLVGWTFVFSSTIFTVAVAMAKVASEVKAADIKVLFVKPLVYWTRFFIIATAFSRPQIDAIGYVLRIFCEAFVCMGKNRIDIPTYFLLSTH